jgi:addiction module HigA family antidote
MTQPVHPGLYIRDNIIPIGMAVKDAAKQLDVGRPALSNLLNGNADLSPEMAARLEKAFGANAEDLLKRQAEYDQHRQRTSTQNLPVGAYVPQYLTIKANRIEDWVNGKIEPRTLIAVLLRKLINSTGQDLALVDFPGYDQAERHGWDGRVDAGAATPWIPIGKSGWEFGCNEEPKQKANDDFAARLKAVPQNEREDMHFVFVTPRNWKTKEKWRKEKEALGKWKSVRVYDASDIEQWLEQSLQAQRWLSEKMGDPSDGVYSLDQQWHDWASVTDPELSKELFAPSVEHFKSIVKNWIENPSAAPLIICGDSKIEALAFLHCMFEQEEHAFRNLGDRLLVFSSGPTLRRLTTASPAFVPIVFTDDAEREIGGEYKKRHTIIVRPRNTVEPEPTIILDLLGYEAFRKAMEAMGVNDHLKINDLGHESGYSPTILRRRLSRVPAIRTPEWAQNNAAVRKLIPIMLVGSWHTQSKGDCEIMHVIAGKSCDEIEKDVMELLNFDDPPVWSAGRFRGVASKIDAFFAVQSAVTRKDLEDFLLAAEIVLSEQDPALELSEDKRGFANLYGKSREHSGALNNGICETLVLLAVHGNSLFEKRLGMNVAGHVDGLIRRLLTPLTPEKLLSQTGHLPMYAEAAPQEFLRIIDEDLKTPEPQVYSLMKPVDNGIFGGGCPRTGLLWALENLAWKPEQLPLVCSILARLSQRKINDNWVNKPEHSLDAIFRSWMPQTAASLEERKRNLEVLTQKFRETGWKICVAQFSGGHDVGDYSHRPKWRSDASGAGQPLSDGREIYEFRAKALELALAWPHHDEKTLGDLVVNLQGIAEKERETVWDLVDAWATKEKDESKKVILREQIRRFAFLRVSAKRGVTGKTKDRARKAYELLTPADVVTKHIWLFEKQWVEESYEELEDGDFDYKKREDKIRKSRIAALQEIWNARGLDGIKTLLSSSGAAWNVGWHMAEGVIPSGDEATFIEQCLRVGDADLQAKCDEAVRGFLHQISAALRADVTRTLVGVLSPDLGCRLLKCSPFQQDTWEYVDAQGEALRKQYWSEVYPPWLKSDSPDLNEVIDRLLEARRPRAAFFAVHFGLAEVETSRLKRLLQEVATCDSEPSGTYQLDSHYLSDALATLQKRVGVTEEELARLEFLFVRALEHTSHGIPNLEKQVGKSPALLVQAVALIYRRDDGGEDPPEWDVKDPEQRSAVGTAAYRLLANIKRIPGTDDTGKIDEDKLRAWVKEAQALCKKYGRAEIGDQKIGQILSHPVMGSDGVWPCEQVRNVLEECGTADIGTGVEMGVYNSRGVHARGEGGGQERAIAEKYRNWSRNLAFEYPYVARVLQGIAETYEREATREDTETAVRRRLRH